jgi:hypothetical protein
LRSKKINYFLKIFVILEPKSSSFLKTFFTSFFAWFNFSDQAFLISSKVFSNFGSNSSIFSHQDFLTSLVKTSNLSFHKLFNLLTCSFSGSFLSSSKTSFHIDKISFQKISAFCSEVFHSKSFLNSVQDFFAKSNQAASHQAKPVITLNKLIYYN